MKHIIEAYSRIDEQAHITGIALIPRISRNDNLYTKDELKRFDNKTVPLNWEHDPSKKIGKVTFHYNQELETVFYDGMITDEGSANLARNKILFTSIEADPQGMKEICNGPTDCFNMPFGLNPIGLALTETPGIPETSLKVIESFIKENCVQDCIKDKKDAGKDIDDKAIAICHSECDDNKEMVHCPEGQIHKDGHCVDAENLQKEINFLNRRVTELEEKLRPKTCERCGKQKKLV